jgi:hypothetical protein
VRQPQFVVPARGTHTTARETASPLPVLYGERSDRLGDPGEGQGTLPIVTPHSPDGGPSPQRSPREEQGEGEVIDRRGCRLNLNSSRSS